MLLSAAAAAAEVYRWVDENGEVHYSETLPPGWKDQGHDVLNRDGMVVDQDQRLTPPPPEEAKTEEEKRAEEQLELPRDSSGLPRPKPLYSKEETQRRMDNFLMLRYESEQEIIDAMEVEIKQLNYDRRLLEGTRQSVNEAYRGQIREAANTQRAGKPVSEADTRQIADLKRKLNENDRSLAALNRREEEIRSEFLAQVERYRLVVEKYSEDESD